jgi:hypothetical protein
MVRNILEILLAGILLQNAKTLRQSSSRLFPVGRQSVQQVKNG